MIVAVGFAIVSCTRGRDADSSDEISGAYAREYSFKVVNPETGSEIGMRTVRDTIFVGLIESGYEVSNKKWRLNDYDREGWQSMEHDEDRPIPSFLAKFNSSNGSLNAESNAVLFLDLEKGKLFKDEGREKPYQKLRN
jgi:hypothetical protein